MGIIQYHGRPLTFAEIRGDSAPSPSLERSVRRALHKLVQNGALIAMGDGGRADPFRYFLNPMLIGMTEDKSQRDALVTALEADPGLGTAMFKLSKITSASSPQ
jgi:hypothetical protein